ncbi:MAG: EamA family transporter, partial [Pseudomonas sp.]|nr:EamA family transporter [Pseudomonas sp.]
MRLVDLLRMLSLAGIWGASFLFMRIIAPVLGTIPTAFFRVSIAATGLVVILALMRVRWDFGGKLKVILILGVINSGVPATLYSVAAQVLPAGYSSIFNATTPLMGVLIGGLFFSEKLTLTKMAGVFLGLLGVGILTRAGPVAFNLDLLMGALACLLATTFYGFAGFLARRWLDQQGGLDPRLSALGSMLGATLFLLPLFGLSVINQPPVSWGGTSVWLSLLGLGLVCTAFA